MVERTLAEQKALKNPDGLSYGLLRAQALFLGEHPDVWATHTEAERKYTIKTLAAKMVKKLTRNGEKTTAEAKAEVKAHFKKMPRKEADLEQWERDKPERVKAEIKAADEPRRK